jgi:hypothetical protein
MALEAKRSLYTGPLTVATSLGSTDDKARDPGKYVCVLLGLGAVSPDFTITRVRHELTREDVSDLIKGLASSLHSMDTYKPK